MTFKIAGLPPGVIFLVMLAVTSGIAGAAGSSGSVVKRNRWTFLGPGPAFGGTTRFSGRVDVAVPDPQNPNVMYVGAGDGGGPDGGGVWKTSNWLSTSPNWIPLTDKFPSLSIFSKSLAFFPGKKRGTLYAAAQGPNGGILRSSDGGAHWKFLAGDLFNGALFGAVAVSPSDSKTLYVAAGGTTTHGVYKSTDGGKTWNNITATSIGLGNASDIVIDPKNPSTLYAGIVNGSATGATNGGVYRSIDAGQSWTPMSLPLPAGFTIGDFIALRIAPSDSKYVYATVLASDDTADNPHLQRFRTIDAGASWQLLNLPNAKVPNLCKNTDPTNTLQDFRYWHIVLVDPKNPNLVYANACEPTFVASQDGGTSWEILSTVDDIVNVFFDQGDELVLVGDRGIHSSANPLGPNAVFTSKQGNLGNVLMHSFALDPLNESIIYGIAQDQLSGIQFTGSTAWNYLSAGTEVGRTLVNPSNDDRVYTWGVDNGKVLLKRSVDGGQTWKTEMAGLDITDFGTGDDQDEFNAFALDPSDPSRIVVGGQHVWEAIDQGPSQPLSWSELDTAPLSPGNLLGSIAFAAGSRGQTIYAGTAGGQFFVSTDGGASWSNISPEPTILASTSAIVVDPNDPSRVFINTVGAPGASWNLSDTMTPTCGRIWLTTNGGTTWSSVAGSLPSNLTVSAITADFRYSEPTLYAGTDRGLFRSRNFGTTWTRFGKSLPAALSIQDMELLPQSGILGVASFGRGVWETVIPGPQGRSGSQLRN